MPRSSTVRPTARWTLNGDGSFEYTPAEGFVGTDSFSYVASDGQADSNLAVVTVTVQPVNSAPAAADDSYEVKPDETLTVDDGGVLANDSDPDGDPLQAQVVEGPEHGSLTLGADGSFQYTPDPDYRGTDTFTYVASDGQNESEPATVTISVQQTTMRIHLEVSGTPFGTDAGQSWAGSTFWVSVYVEDLRDAPQGVVGGAIDILFESLGLTPTGNVAYGDAFTAYQQGTADDAAGLVDETGALATAAGVGIDGAAAFVAWEFQRDGENAPSDANSHQQFTISPAQGDGTILPSNFAWSARARRSTGTTSSSTAPRSTCSSAISTPTGPSTSSIWPCSSRRIPRPPATRATTRSTT